MTKKQEVKKLINEGWNIKSDSEYGTTLEKRKRFNWLWFIIFGIFYIIYYFATRMKTKTVM